MDEKVVSCRDCRGSFAHLKTFRKHRRVKHHESNLISKIKCPFVACESMFVFYKHLDDHLKSQHSIEIEEEIVMFDDKEEFEKWRQERYNFYYEQFNFQNLGHYYCHSSKRKEALEEVEQKKSFRRNELVKRVDGNCPARLSLSEVNGKLRMIWIKTHCGHDLTPYYVRLSKEQKTMVESISELDFNSTRRCLEPKVENDYENDQKITIVKGSNSSNISSSSNSNSGSNTNLFKTSSTITFLPLDIDDQNSQESLEITRVFDSKHFLTLKQQPQQQQSSVQSQETKDQIQNAHIQHSLEDIYNDLSFVISTYDDDKLERALAKISKFIRGLIVEFDEEANKRKLTLMPLSKSKKAKFINTKSFVSNLNNM